MAGFFPTTTELHHIAQQGWPGTRQETLGEWTLRFGHGNTRRANSALATGSPGIPLAEALDAVTARYVDAGQPSYLMVPVELDGARPEVDDVADAAGWTIEAPSTHMTLDLDGFPAESVPSDVLRFHWSDDAPATMGADDPVALTVLTASPARYLTAWLGGQFLGHGRLSLCDQWCGVSNLLVVEAARGRGLGRALMREIQSEGVRQGCRYAYLQVEQDNVVAHSLYGSMGWADHSFYHYRRGPVPA